MADRRILADPRELMTGYDHPTLPDTLNRLALAEHGPAGEHRWVDVTNPDYGASGSSQSTTGSITTGTNTLTIAGAIDFVDGQGISIVGAGVAGADLITQISSGGGTVNLVLVDNASTTVSGAAVEHDDTIAIQAAIDSLGGTITSPGIVRFPSNSDFLISSSLIVPAYVSLVGGQQTLILADSGGSFINNYMILCNIADGSNQDVAYPNIESAEIRNLTIYNPNSPYTVKGILCADSRRFLNITGRQLDNTITLTSNYLDNVEIKRMFCPAGAASGLDYQIVINQLGDGLKIENVIIDATSKGIYIDGCFGGRIQNVISGSEHTTRRSGALTLSNWHCESTIIKIIETDLVIENSLFWHNGTDIPIQFSEIGSDGKHVVELKNVMLGVFLDVTTTQDYDIQTHANFHLVLNNVYKKLVESGVIVTSEIAGIKIKNQAGSDFAEFNNYSYALSKYSEIGYGELLYYDFVTGPGSGSLFMNALQTSSKVTWQKATDTYFYRATLLFDDDRKIGKTSDEKNIAVTNGGNGVLWPIAYGSYPRNTTLRIYRGTTTNSYDEYVDLPVINTRLLYDDGDEINGFLWQARGAGAADSVTFYVLKANQSNVTAYGTTAPTVGTWNQGDVVYDTTPSASGKIGWVCTTAGTPGTWKAFGAIDS